jgi:hypothetical protein
MDRATTWTADRRAVTGPRPLLDGPDPECRAASDADGAHHLARLARVRGDYATRSTRVVSDDIEVGASAYTRSVGRSAGWP